MAYTGYSKRNWDIMNKYNAWQLIFPPVKDLIGTPAFDAYIAKALNDSDAGYKKPSPMYKHYFFMAVLWPAVERRLKTRPFDQVLNEVLTEEYQVNGGGERDRKEIRELFTFEYLMTHPEKITDLKAFKASNCFPVALDLLKVRAAFDSSLKKQVDYFTN